MNKLKNFTVDEMNLPDEMKNCTVVEMKLPDEWGQYKEFMDYVFYVQKQGQTSLPHMLEVHEGIEDLSAYYESAEAGVSRATAANYIATTLKNKDEEWKIPKFLKKNQIQKLSELIVKLQEIVNKYPREAYSYFD